MYKGARKQIKIYLLSFCFSKNVLRGLKMSCVTKIYVRQNVQCSSNCFRTHCSYLIYNIIKRYSTNVVQIMPLGFSILSPLWPLIFSSGERPRALWALLLLDFYIKCFYVYNINEVTFGVVFVGWFGLAVILCWTPVCAAALVSNPSMFSTSPGGTTLPWMLFSNPSWCGSAMRLLPVVGMSTVFILCRIWIKHVQWVCFTNSIINFKVPLQ